MTSITELDVDGQTPIPRTILDTLGATAGDLLAWEIEREGVVRVRRVHERDRAYFKAVKGTLTEWSSLEDSEAFDEL